jgi:hypothetical protein
MPTMGRLSLPWPWVSSRRMPTNWGTLCHAGPTTSATRLSHHGEGPAHADDRARPANLASYPGERRTIKCHRHVRTRSGCRAWRHNDAVGGETEAGNCSLFTFGVSVSHMFKRSRRFVAFGATRAAPWLPPLACCGCDAEQVLPLRAPLADKPA